MWPHNKHSELILNDANDRVKDAGEEFSPTNPTPTVSRLDLSSITMDDNGDEFERAKEKVAEIQQRRVETEREREATSDVLRLEADLVKRTRSLYSKNLIELPDFKEVHTKAGTIVECLNTDRNRKAIVDTILTDEEAIHWDEYQGRIVDHEGKPIDKQYSTGLWLDVFAAASLKGTRSVSFKQARESLYEIGLHNRRNDLTRRLAKLIPEWDRTPRMEKYLIEHFETFDSECSREFGRYFWMSLYMRLMNPGALAPMVLAIFGTQGAGKSRFGNELAQIITGDDKAAAIQWDLDGEMLDFLRNITGHSPIAVIGETGGMARSDWNKVKQRIPLGSDMMHWKFEDQFMQQRQWIAIMDGNTYAGLQRDDTGNRRFKAIFAGQMPDVDGKPAWRQDFVITEERWAAFRADVWQLLAEAADWVKKNGKAEYEAFVRRVSAMVFEENARERAMNRGTVRNPDIENYGRAALAACPKKLIGNVTKRSETQRVWIKWTDIHKTIKKLSGNNNINAEHFRLHISSMGGVDKPNSGYAGFVFDRYASIDDMNEAFALRIGCAEDGDDAILAEGAGAAAEAADLNGGF